MLQKHSLKTKPLFYLMFFLVTILSVPLFANLAIADPKRESPKPGNVPHGEKASQPRTIDNNADLDLKLCAETIIKAYRIIRVGKAQVWLTDCAISEKQFFDVNKRLVFFYEKGVPARAFKEASIYYLEKNFGEQHLAKIKDSVDQFNSNYQSVEPGDVYTLSHSTTSGLTLYKNSEYLATMSNRMASRDYFSIWFGEKPFNGPMKKDLFEQLR